MKRILFALAVLLAPALAAADGYTTTALLQDNTNGATLLTAAPLNVTQTITARLSNASYSEKAQYTKIKITVAYTYSAATEVQVAWKCSTDKGVTYGTETSRDPNASTTITSYQDTIAPGAANFTLNLDWGVKGCTDIQIVFTSTAGDGSDVITVTGTAIAGS